MCSPCSDSLDATKEQGLGFEIVQMCFVKVGNTVESVLYICLKFL